MSKYTETVNNSKAITDNYTVKKEKISGITVYMYIPKEKKEKDMKETNLDYYKRELGKIFYQGCGNPAAMFDKIKTKCDSNIRSCCWTTYTRDILEWMSQPYKESILNDTEKEYLADVIRPFREKVNTISKFHSWDDSSQYIYIETEDNHFATLPVFPKGTMYKGMKEMKHYTLEELDL